MTTRDALTRRDAIKKIGLNGFILATAAGSSLPAIAKSTSQDPSEYSVLSRRLAVARDVREKALARALDHSPPEHVNNREELDYPYLAAFTKGLSHNQLGEVEPAVWAQFAKALQGGKFEEFERIPIRNRKLKNPLAGLSFELLGPDPTLFTLAPAPRIDNSENSAEMSELYWQALTRDIPFTQYGSAALCEEAASDLSAMKAFNAGVTSQNLFRGKSPGASLGPYVSQFLQLDVPVGVPFDADQQTALTLNQRNRTLVPGANFLTDYSSWLHCQNGGFTIRKARFDETPRYIRNGRDLANAVHLDVPWQFAMNAAYILFNMKAPLSRGLPYENSRTMEGFASFGYPHLMALIAEAAVRAARAVWFQKWWVHRRLRPETFGGRIHNHLTGKAKYEMIDSHILNSRVLERVLESNRRVNADGSASYLLSQVYPEGCALHPAYASGHAAMIGAAVTVLKTWFDESWVLPAPMEPEPDGLSLKPYRGEPLTVGGELNKLASNVSIGRNWAGIHWRTDAENGMQLGETVALRLLEELSGSFSETTTLFFSRFDGSICRVQV